MSSSESRLHAGDPPTPTPGVAGCLRPQRVRDMGELDARGPVVAVDDGFTVAQTLAVLRKHNFLSVPVVRKGDEARVLGLVNLVDIVTAVVFQPVFSEYDTDTDISDVSGEVMEAAQNIAVFERPVSSLIGISRESQEIWAFDEGDPLDRVLDTFSAGVHRALCRSARAGEPSLRLFSQTDLVRHLRGLGALAPVFARPVNQTRGVRHLAGLADGGGDAVIQLKASQTALTGFRRMMSPEGAPVPALPLVGDDGRVVASLSLSDLRGFRADIFNLVLLPAREFLEFVRDPKAPHDAGPVTCRPDEPLGDVIDRLLARRVHRAWVVGDRGQPVGVVSMTDVVAAVRFSR